MKLNRSIRTILGLSLTVATLWACDDYTDTDPAPFDIINGKVDLQQQYYKSVLKRPVTISGQITNRKTTEPLGGVKITARLENSKTVYTALSNDDGAFLLYVEGGLSYIVYGEKTGFDKTYYEKTVNNVVDTTFTINSNTSGYNIALRLVDTTPTFTINQGTSIANFYASSQDLSFNGTNIIAMNYSNSNFYFLDANGNYAKNTPMNYYSDFFTAQGTDWFLCGTINSDYLYKFDQKTGNYLGYILCDYLGAIIVDVEIYNSNIWLLGQDVVYKLTMTGDLVEYINFNDITTSPDLRGVVQKNGYLYFLNYSSLGSSYVLYKIDPATLEVVAKGNFPAAYSSLVLSGLTFDKTNFWTINTTQTSFMKFSTVE